METWTPRSKLNARAQALLTEVLEDPSRRRQNVPPWELLEALAKSQVKVPPPKERKKPGPKKGSKSIPWSVRELMFLKALHPITTGEKIRRVLAQKFGAKRTVKTIHQTFADYFGPKAKRRLKVK